VRGGPAAILFLLASCLAEAPEPPDPGADQRSVERRPERPSVVPNPLVLGVLPIFDPEEMIALYSPLARYLGQELGTEVRLELSEDYATMVERIAEGHVDIAQLAPLAYVRAKAKDPSLQILLTNISEGSSTYSGYIFAKSDAQLRHPSDFRGKRFGFVDPDSTSGYLYPYAFFLEQGIVPERDFKEVVMTKRHDLVIEELVHGRIDAAASFSGALLNAEAQGIDTEGLQIVAKTGRIPYDAWCARAGLDSALKAAIKGALQRLSTRTPVGRRILGGLRPPINGFAEARDENFEDIRRILKVVESKR
jgi:phosphate/phosphite/phosphonate ABC transporter binding protein